MLKVTLAGYNVDASVLKALKGGDMEAINAMSPEVLCAAFARASRDPRSLEKLREVAANDIDRARQTNKTVVFGMGHASISEHAVLNFTIQGISRLAVEVLESHRLASYTEKSQRYTTVGKDVLVPGELQEGKDHERFINFLQGQANSYDKIRSGIRRSLLEGVQTPEEIQKASGAAREDARYCLPLACTTQLGMTVNARNLELMIRRFISHPYLEVQELGAKLAEAAIKVIPSLLRRLDPVPLFKDLPKELKVRAGKRCDTNIGSREPTLWDYSNIADEELYQTILFKYSQDSLRTCNKLSWGDTEIAATIATVFKHMNEHDAVPREFELIDYTWEACVSASCFAQLKRHRMCTLISQDYNHEMPYVIPPAIAAVPKLLEEYSKVCDRAVEYRRSLVAEGYDNIADYVVLSSFRRRVLVKMNLRSMFAFCRLRMDRHAQWEIRELANKICKLVSDRRVSGEGLSKFLCGKDTYEEKYDEVFGPTSYVTKFS